MRTLLAVLILLMMVFTAAAQEPEDLTETYTDEAFSIQYPAGWDWEVAQGDEFYSIFYLSNWVMTAEEREAIFNSGDTLNDLLLTKEQFVGIYFIINSGNMSDDDDLWYEWWENWAVDIFCEEAIFCEEPARLNWESGLAISLKHGFDNNISALAIVGQAEDYEVHFFGFAQDETLDALEPTLIAMFQSIEFTSVPVLVSNPEFATLEFSETHEQRGITFGYAETWAITAHSVDELPVIASNPSRLTRDQGAVIPDDEFMLRVYPPEVLASRSITPDMEPAEALPKLLDLGLTQAEAVEPILIGDLPAARIYRPQREFQEAFYAVQLDAECLVVFALMTSPASTEKFAGLLPYWLETVTCD